MSSPRVWCWPQLRMQGLDSNSAHFRAPKKAERGGGGEATNSDFLPAFGVGDP